MHINIYTQGIPAFACQNINKIAKSHKGDSQEQKSCWVKIDRGSRGCTTM